MIRVKKKWGIVCACLTALALALFWFLQGDAGSSAHRPVALSPDATQVIETTPHTKSETRAPIVAPFLSENQRITEDEQRIISSALAEAQAAFEKIEAENSSVIYAREFAVSQIRQIKVTPPQLEQMSGLYSALSASLKLLQSGSAAQLKLRKETNKLIKEYALYPRPVKLLDLLVPVDKSKNVKFLEFFVNDESEIKLSEEGILTFPINPEVKGDEDFGGKGSWGQKRYAHLITIER